MRNEAAERLASDGEALLRKRFDRWKYGTEWHAALDEALAAERRATVAAAVRYANHGRTPPPNDPCESCAMAVGEVLAILDEEAAR